MVLHWIESSMASFYLELLKRTRSLSDLELFRLGILNSLVDKKGKSCLPALNINTRTVPASCWHRTYVDGY